MGDPHVRELLAGQTDLRLCARALGKACLDAYDQLNVGWHHGSETAKRRRVLEQAVITVDLAWWFADERKIDGFGALLDKSEVRTAFGELNQLNPPVAALAILRAMCLKPLVDFYIRTHTAHELDRGDPVPLAGRGKPLVSGKPTPTLARMQTGTLLAGTPFALYCGCGETPIVFCLDFSDRDNLDAATWIKLRGGAHSRGCVPNIASIHPYASADELKTADAPPGESWFFGVHPEPWKPKTVLHQLASATTSADIAVLPELSLPAPDALADALREEWSKYPALVVAGSAHIEHPGDEGHERVRANESHVYLYGARLLVHRKLIPFETSYLGKDHDHTPRTEDISQGDRKLTIAAGSSTSLAVLICADLNSEIPALLAELGVNLLLVPALTPSPGGFENAATTIATHRQGFTVVVNGTPATDPDKPPKRKPFMVITGVPVDTVQVRQHGAPKSGRRAVGVVRLQAARRVPVWL